MPRQTPSPSGSNLRSAAATVRASISGQTGAIADALTAIASALDQAQAVVETLEASRRELASPNTRDARQPTSTFVSGDRIIGGIEVQGPLDSVAGQGLDLTFQNQVGTVESKDHDTGGALRLQVTGNPVTVTGKVGLGTASPIAPLSLGNNAQATLVTYANGDLANLNFYQSAANGFQRYLDIVSGGSNAGGNIRFITGPAAGNAVVAMTIDPAQHIGFAAIPVYANNAAALAGGLVATQLYRTGADPDPLCIVH